jgi:hypothetical protein
VIELERDDVLGGRRRGPTEAAAAGLAGATAEKADLPTEARKLASSLASEDRRMFETLARTLHADIAAGFGVER